MSQLKPDQTLAFLPELAVERLAEQLMAFANAEGGLLVLGVQEDGKWARPLWPEEAELALRKATLLCHPPVLWQWEQVEWGSRKLIGVRVARSSHLHSLANGQILVRRGAHNRPISAAELSQLTQTRLSGTFEEDPVAGATRADFDDVIIEEYLRAREKRGAARVTGLEQLLHEIGALDREGRPTVTGILLFGKAPQMFLPQNGVVFVRFATDEPRGDEGGIGYSRRKEINGPLARIIEETWNTVRQEIGARAQVRGLVREELPEYPNTAVREAIVNAVCHRDYSLRGRKIEIRMYRDRLEVISPGGLAGYMTLDNLQDEHYSRNPRLVNGLFYWGYIEELGLGIDQMIEEMVQAGNPPPIFAATTYAFRVTLKKAREETALPPLKLPGALSSQTNARQQLAMTHVQEQGSITNGVYQQLCPDISAETLRRDLVDLVERGIFLKIGSKKGTHYILSKES